MSAGSIWSIWKPHLKEQSTGSNQTGQAQSILASLLTRIMNIVGYTYQCQDTKKRAWHNSSMNDQGTTRFATPTHAPQIWRKGAIFQSQGTRHRWTQRVRSSSRRWTADTSILVEQSTAHSLYRSASSLCNKPSLPMKQWLEHRSYSTT